MRYESAWYSISETDHALQYAKEEDDPDGVAIRITAYNRGPEVASLHILPTLWYPNTWSWPSPKPPKPTLRLSKQNVVTSRHPSLGKTYLYCLPSPPPVGTEQAPPDEEEEEEESIEPEMLFTENDTNFQRLYGGQNESAYVKDAFHDHVIPAHRPKCCSSSASNGDRSEQASPRSDEGNSTPVPHQHDFVNPQNEGTKFAAHYTFKNVPANGGCAVVRLKLTRTLPEKDATISDDEAFDDLIDERRQEADEFYSRLASGPISDDLRQIMRQALGGMMWSKQHYRFIHSEWLNGDPGQPPPPPERQWIRNRVRQVSCHASQCSLTLDRNGDIFISKTSFRCQTNVRALYLLTCILC